MLRAPLRPGNYPTARRWRRRVRRWYPARDRRKAIDVPRTGTALFLFAHHDDELFAAAALAAEKASGRAAAVVFTTHGSRYGTAQDTRFRESSAALADLGVLPGQVFLAGLESDTPDFSLVNNLPACYGRMKALTEGLPLARVYVPAWEGGHPDHDATHLLGLRLARERGGLPTLAYPAYRAALCPLPLWRTMTPLPGERVRTRRLGPGEGWRALRLVRRFPSQWRSLAGLLPGMTWRLCLRCREELVEVGERDYTAPPHPGRLFYTRRYGLSFETFSAAAAPFLEGWGGPRPAGGP